MTRDEIRTARDWLDNQLQVVNPGPIQTISEALDIAEGIIAARELRQRARAAGVPLSDNERPAGDIDAKDISS